MTVMRRNSNELDTAEAAVKPYFDPNSQQWEGTDDVDLSGFESEDDTRDLRQASTNTKKTVGLGTAKEDEPSRKPQVRMSEPTH
jgi:hypothetical protein